MTRKLILIARIAATLILIIFCSIIMLGFTVATLGCFVRKNFVWILTPCARLILRLWRLRMDIIPCLPTPNRQTVFVFNHASTIDIFALMAMGLPNTRFFLSGYLRKNPAFAVLGYLTGIFWTVPQQFSERRARIFHNACETLKRTGQSVALSPEGERVTTGKIGTFNKGAFHLAPALKAPMRPLFIDIPAESNAGIRWFANPGLIRIWVGDMIDTSDWRPEDAARTKDEVRQMYVEWKNQLEIDALDRSDA